MLGAATVAEVDGTDNTAVAELVDTSADPIVIPSMGMHAMAADVVTVIAAGWGLRLATETMFASDVVTVT